MDDIFCIMAHSLTAFLVCLTLCQIMISWYIEICFLFTH
jgi:hypothetical protein